MSFAATQVEKTVRRLVSDPDGDRWDDADIIDTINETLFLMVDASPQINMREIEVTLTTDAYKQTLPENIARVREFSHTIVVADDLEQTPGSECTQVDIDDLALERTSWKNDEAAAEVVHYLFTDPSDREFYVWPPQPAQTNPNLLVGTMAVYPTAITDLVDAVDLHPRYKSALANIVAGRLLEDEPDEPAQNRAGRYLSRGYQQIGVSLQNDDAARMSNMS